MPTEETIADKILTEWGAKVTAVPTSQKQEADWLVDVAGCEVLIEEKLKIDDPLAVAERDKMLAAGEIHHSSVPLIRSNRLSAIVKKASAQLSSTGASHPGKLRVLWLTGDGHHAREHYEQLIASLYGTAYIVTLEETELKLCYFFKFNDFFARRNELDGAVAAYIAGDTVELKLCLNPYSPNWERLRDSAFAALFDGEVMDPVAEEAAGKAYLVNGDVDLKDENAVIEYIKEKYKLKYAMPMQVGMLTLSTQVPRA